MIDAGRVAIPLGEGGHAGDQAPGDGPRVHGLSVGVEIRLDDAEQRRGSPHGSRFEVLGVVLAKIPVDDRHQHLVPERRLLAGVTRLDLAGRRAAVAVEVVAVVAVLADHDAVAAARSAGTLGAVRLALTVRRAPIEWQRVGVVAALCPLDHLVTADRGGAYAGVARALEAELRLACGRAAVTRCVVAVVAKLRQHHRAVATAGDPVAGLPGRNARVSGLDGQTVGGAAVSRDLVAVVAGLVIRPITVPAHGVGGADEDSVRIEGPCVDGRREGHVGTSRGAEGAGGTRASGRRRVDARTTAGEPARR